MAHIDLPQGAGPGIVGLFQFRPETAQPLGMLAETLLRGPSSLSSGEREMIAARVSRLNQCRFCAQSHGAAAAYHTSKATMDAVWKDPETAPISPKLKALLAIADKVQGDARRVSKDDIAAAREEGATDVEIHDAVLIAAAFCMFNRYVDGLGTFQPEDPAAYEPMGKMLAEEGYVRDR
jgi:uncharacterized peroxidase-related enzyme